MNADVAHTAVEVTERVLLSTVDGHALPDHLQVPVGELRTALREDVLAALLAHHPTTACPAAPDQAVPR